MTKQASSNQYQSTGMLARMRNRIVLINTMIVGLILVLLFSSVLFAGYKQSLNRINRTLTQSISRVSEPGPGQNGTPPQGPTQQNTTQQSTSTPPAAPNDNNLRPFDGGREAGALDTTLTIVLELGKDGSFTEVANDGITLDDEALTGIAAFAKDMDKNDLQLYRTENVFLLKQSKADKTYVAIAGSYNVFDNLQSTMTFMILVWFVFMTIFLVITIVMTNQTLKPVRRSWQQQQQFVADASHELKTPLTVILANNSILQADDSLTEDARQWVDSTGEEATHMQTLINHMLYLARNDSGNQKLIMQELSLSDMVEEDVLQFEPVAFDRGITIESHVQEDIRLSGDATMIRQLTHILLDNACKYGAENSTVDVTLKKDRGGALFSVHNMGVPIPEEDLPHIFDRFYRSDKARTVGSETGGYGLGLAIAKTIAEEHKGDITATSSEQAGTTFTVHFKEILK